jgi:PAS domain S-box-containing protein
MNLRIKTFIIISIVFVIAFAVMAVMLRYFILKSYLQEENQLTVDKVVQVDSVLESSLNTLNSLVIDWAEWDDSYQFMKDHNSNYLRSNYVSSVFLNLHLNMAVIMDTDGKVVYSQYYNWVSGDTDGQYNWKLSNMPDSLSAYLKPGSPLLAYSDTDPGVKGNISLPESPMLIVSHPILTSQGRGPYRGTLIFGRYLDSIELKTVADITHISIKDYKINDIQMPADLKSAQAALLQGQSMVVQALDEKTIAGYTLLKDINGQPDLILKIDSPRTLYIQSNNNLVYYTLAFLAFGLLFIMVAILIIERLIISRISNLSFSVNSISQKGSLSSRISLPGKDEVSRLANNINNMLGNIEESHKLQKESETFNYILLQDSPNPIEVMNSDGSLRFVNSALEKITGYSRVQLIGRKPPFPWWTNDNTQQYFAELQESMSKGDHKMEKQFQKPNGDYFWVDISSTAMKQDGDVKFFISNWVDVTERKKADETIRHSELRFRELAELLPELVFETDFQGNLTFVNRVALNIFGYSPGNYSGLKLVDLIAPEDRERANLEISRMIAGEESGDTEFTAIRKDGQRLPCFIHASPVRDSYRKVVGLRGILIDITVQKTASQELKTLYEREKNLREALQAEIKSRIEFTRALVHELKTPLTPIMVSSELLAEELKEEPLLGLAKVIARGAENMNQRVNELLDMARGELGMLKVKLSMVEPEEILREVVKYMDPVVNKSKQTLSLILPDHLPSVIADEDRVRQVLFNLLSNAIKYSPEGGQTTVRTRIEPDDLVIDIEDTGQGISEEEQTKLFQPYYRIEGQEHLSGLGLGLALSKRLVELQNGKIWVKSQKGKGSTFSFSLPLKRINLMELGKQEGFNENTNHRR